MRSDNEHEEPGKVGPAITFADAIAKLSTIKDLNGVISSVVAVWGYDGKFLAALLVNRQIISTTWGYSDTPEAATFLLLHQCKDTLERGHVTEEQVKGY